MVLWANIQIMVKNNLRHAYVSIYFADVSQQKTEFFLHGSGNFPPFLLKCHRQQKIGLTPSHKVQIIVLTPKSQFLQVLQFLWICFLTMPFRHVVIAEDFVDSSLCATFPYIFHIFSPNLMKLSGYTVLWPNIWFMVKKFPVMLMSAFILLLSAKISKTHVFHIVIYLMFLFVYIYVKILTNIQSPYQLLLNEIICWHQHFYCKWPGNDVEMSKKRPRNHEMCSTSP